MAVLTVKRLPCSGNDHGILTWISVKQCHLFTKPHGARICLYLGGILSVYINVHLLQEYTSD